MDTFKSVHKADQGTGGPQQKRPLEEYVKPLKNSKRMMEYQANNIRKGVEGYPTAMYLVTIDVSVGEKRP